MIVAEFFDANRRRSAIVYECAGGTSYVLSTIPNRKGKYTHFDTYAEAYAEALKFWNA